MTGRILRLLLAALLALSCALTATPVSGAKHKQRGGKARHGKQLKAKLKGANEVPGPGDPDGRGKARLRVRPKAGRVCFRLKWRNIATPTAAHIHRGRMGEAGPVVVGLFSGQADNRGCVDGFERDLLREIRRHPRRFYVNIHNADYPDGAIRGQLKRRGRHRDHRRQLGLGHAGVDRRLLEEAVT